MIEDYERASRLSEFNLTMKGAANHIRRGVGKHYNYGLFVFL